jgi:ppGpp synthetase/RelA/SpoT-type nucleotidyltranferase
VRFRVSRETAEEFFKAVGVVKQHTRQIGGKPVVVKQHQRKFKGRRRPTKVSVKRPRAPAAPAQAPEPEPMPAPTGVEALPDVAQEQFTTAYAEHIATAKKTGAVPLSREQASAKFVHDYNVALRERQKFDSARVALERELSGMFPGKDVFGRTKTPESMAGKIVRYTGTGYVSEDVTELWDIGGTTLVADNIQEQQSMLDRLQRDLKPYGRASWEDGVNFNNYLATPKGGYRAIHFYAEINGKPVELQLKTLHQKKWSVLSHETFYSKIDNPLKGNEEFSKYMTAIGAWLEKKDRGIDPGPKPPCQPPVAAKLDKCL